MNLPEIIVRAFSTDQSQVDKYFYGNCFQLKGFKDEADQPVIIDVGAGIGAFAFSSLAMGAKKIYCIEPYFPNFKQLLKNTELWEDKVSYHNFGIYTVNDTFEFLDPVLQEGVFYDFSDIDIEAGTNDHQRTYRINKTTTLDDFIERYVAEDKVDILKISIGYAELDILEKSVLLHGSRIESICGETSESPERIETFKTRMKEKSYAEFYVAQNKEEENKYTFLLSKTNIDKHFNIQKT